MSLNISLGSCQLSRNLLLACWPVENRRMSAMHSGPATACCYTDSTTSLQVWVQHVVAWRPSIGILHVHYHHVHCLAEVQLFCKYCGSMQWKCRLAGLGFPKDTCRVNFTEAHLWSKEQQEDLGSAPQTLFMVIVFFRGYHVASHTIVMAPCTFGHNCSSNTAAVTPTLRQLNKCYC